MTEAPTISGGRAVPLGPGRLILVVGPSGAGKDTLLGLARAACADGGSIVFSRRMVTREASPFEDNEQMSPEAFRQARMRGDFAVSWDAHGHSYGLSRSIDDDIRTGRTVVANVSRTVVDVMRRVYADVMVVSVTAPPEILAERLAMRARSTDGPVTDRLRRAVDGVAAAPDITITNVGTVEHHARELVRIIKGEAAGGAAAGTSDPVGGPSGRHVPKPR